MLLLHVADRHRADVCLSRLSEAAAVGCQDVIDPWSDRPFIKCANSYLADPQNAVLPHWPDSGPAIHVADQHTLGYGCSRPASVEPT